MRLVYSFCSFCLSLIALSFVHGSGGPTKSDNDLYDSLGKRQERGACTTSWQRGAPSLRFSMTTSTTAQTRFSIARCLCFTILFRNCETQLPLICEAQRLQLVLQDLNVTKTNWKHLADVWKYGFRKRGLLEASGRENKYLILKKIQI